MYRCLALARPRVRCLSAVVLAAMASATALAGTPNVAADRLLIQLAPGEAPLPPLTPEDPNVFGPAALRAPTAPTAPVMAALLDAGALSVTPAFPGARNAELARSLGLDRYYLVVLDTQNHPDADPEVIAAQFAVIGGAIIHAEPIALGGAAGLDDPTRLRDPSSGDTQPADESGRPDDPDFALQYALENTGQPIPGSTFLPGGPGLPDADMDLVDAWALHRPGPETIIAILDTGVSHSHPDLTPALLPGFDMVDNDDEPDDSVIFSHGTFVAGAAAAVGNNGLGIAGAAWGASILPVRILNTLGGGNAMVGAQGLVYAADRGAHVINMSLGYRARSEALHAAVRYAHASGAVIVAATGNNPSRAVPVPASYPEVIAVTATDHFDREPGFSTIGAEVSVSAPGYNIWSTQDTQFNRDGYDFETGTSMASPLVAATAAIVRSANTALSPPQVAALLEATADDLGEPGWDPKHGHGRVNARAAVEAAFGATPCSRADVNTTGGDTGIPDGVLDGADYTFFLIAWSRNAPAADIVGRSINDAPNGRVDLSDFTAFLTLWSEGCP